MFSLKSTLAISPFHQCLWRYSQTFGNCCFRTKQCLGFAYQVVVFGLTFVTWPGNLLGIELYEIQITGELAFEER